MEVVSLWKGCRNCTKYIHSPKLTGFTCWPYLTNNLVSAFNVAWFLPSSVDLSYIVKLLCCAKQTYCMKNFCTMARSFHFHITITVWCLKPKKKKKIQISLYMCFVMSFHSTPIFFFFFCLHFVLQLFPEGFTNTESAG